MVTIENLIEKKKNDLDYIVIETSGMADPGAIISVFWVDEELNSSVYLDSVITIVDAKNIISQIELKKTDCVNEAQRQIAFADRIIVNKKELIDEQKMQEVLKLIKSINELSIIDITSYSKVNIEEILQVNAFDKEKSLKIANSFQPNLKDKELLIDHINHHKHDDDIKTITLVKSGIVDLDKFDQFMNSLVWEKEENAKWEIYRMKGVLNTGKKNKYSLQCVQDLFIVNKSKVLWKENEEIENKIIFIGRFLDLETFSKLFENTLKK